jgi:putative membrane protein
MKWFLFAGSVVAMFAPSPIWADIVDASNFRHGHMFDMGYGFGNGLMFLGPLLMLAVLVLVIASVVYFMRSNDAASKAASALDTLNLRLARGEIDAAEYRERKDILQA